MRCFITPSFYKYAAEVCLFRRCVLTLRILFHSMFRWPYGCTERRALLITPNASKKNDSSHSVLCWYKWRQLFWSHRGVRNSQTSRCLTVQTQGWTNEMKREQHISSRHIKKESSSGWCLWTHLKKTGVAWIIFCSYWWQFSDQLEAWRPSEPDPDTETLDNISTLIETFGAVNI